MSRSDIKAGRAYVELLLKNNAFMKGLKNSGRRLTSFGLGVAKIGASISAAGGLIIAPFVKAISVFTSVGDTLDKMSQRTGVQASSLAEMGFAAEQSGTKLEVVEKGLNGMTRAILDAERGSSEMVDSLDDIGVSLEDLKGKEVEEQFKLVSAGINDVEDASKRGALAQKLLGRSGRELLPMFGQMEALRQQARDEGLVPTDESVKQAAVLTDAFNVVRRKVGAAFYEIGAAVSGNVLEAVGVVSGLLTVGIKWVKQNGELLVTIMKVGAGLIAAGAAVAAIGGAFVVAGAVLTGMATVFGVIATGVGLAVSAISFMLSPIGLAIGAVGLLVVGLGVATAYWFKFTDSGKAAGASIMSAFGRAREIFNEFYDIFMQTFGGIKDALTAGDLELAGEIALTGLRLVFLKGVDLIAGLFDDKLGGAIKSIALMLSDGNFSGAWEGVVKMMGDLWDGFVTGIVSAIAGAANKVVELWRGMATTIAKTLLEQSAAGGAMGDAATAILGVDMSKEDARDELRRLEAIEKATKAIARAEQDLAEARKSGNEELIRSAEFSLENEKQRLAGASQGGSATDLATQFAAEQISATADNIRQRIEDLKRENTPDPASPDPDAPLVDEAVDREIARLQMKLLSMRKVAARKAAEAFKTDESEELGQRGRTFASSNVYAALIAGRAGGGSKEDRMLKAAEDQRELMKKVASQAVAFNGGLATLSTQIAMSRIKMK